MLEPMTYTQALLGFAVLAGAMSLVPGLDMMMTLNESIHYGRRNGIAASLGIQCGVLVWAVAAAAGLAALISAFPLAYDAIRVVGGLYLLYLGWTMSGASAWVLAKARHMLGRGNGGHDASGPRAISVSKGDGDAARTMSAGADSSVPAAGARRGDAAERPVSNSVVEGATVPPSLLSSWWRGFLTNLLNPKIGVFYVAVIPQFLVPGVSNLLMGASLGMVHVLEGSVVLLVVACAAAYFAGRLSGSRGKTVLSLVSGVIMAVLGGATLFEVVRERMA